MARSKGDSMDPEVYYRIVDLNGDTVDAFLPYDAAVNEAERYDERDGVTSGTTVVVETVKGDGTDERWHRIATENQEELERERERRMLAPVLGEDW